MTTPDDRIRVCLDEQKSFLVDAGAGSGKTSSLVGALQHLLGTRIAASLAQNSQRIACITFTNVATNQIIERTARNPLLHVSTIHDFLWTVIKPHQKALKRALVRYNRELKDSSKRKRDIDQLDSALKSVNVTYSDRGAEYLEGRLFHDDLLEVAVRLFEDNAAMSAIVAARFPFIFVDEYQDTSRLVISILLDHVLRAARDKIVIGLFGDKLQHIYDGGVGEVPLEKRRQLVEITKEENYRCSKAVIAVLNNIRTDITQYAAGSNAEGSAIYMHFRHLDSSADVLAPARDVARQRCNWELAPGKQKDLFLTHRLIARRMQYDELLLTYDRRGSFSRDNLLKGEDSTIQFFRSKIEPLLATWSAGKIGSVLSILRSGGFSLRDNNDKARAKTALDELSKMAATASVGDILRHIRTTGLMVLLDDLAEQLSDNPGHVDTDGLEVSEREVLERQFYQTLFGLTYSQVSSFCRFLEENTPFSTQHGVKGDEFDTVFVVLDDDGAGWNLYSFDKYLSGEDATRNAKRFERTRNLFYVSCSRAIRNLAVVDLGVWSSSKEMRVKSVFGQENCFLNGRSMS